MVLRKKSFVCVLLLAVITIVSSQQKQQCEDFSADGDCRKFIRCFSNLRVKFTCGIGTAWDKNLKTCVHREWVESCSAKARAVDAKYDDNKDSDNILTIEADEDALSNLTLSRSISEASESGVIVTPKQFACSSYCLYGGSCKVVVNTVQCQCPSNIKCQTVVIKPSPCATSPCSNGGLCQNSGANFACRCPLGFIGLTCQVRIDPCASQPCRNGGQCIPTGTTFVCQCPEGYYGACCEFRNYCQPNPCANGGICTQTSTGYICSCPAPFTGSNCQLVITTTVAVRPVVCVILPCPAPVIVYNPCLPNPCQNRGGCGVQANTAKCWCPNTYYGYYCQYARSRSLTSTTCDATCLNGGQCYVDIKKGPSCSCPKEYYGEKCEFVNAPKFCTPNPCMNGGKCISTKDGYKCACENGSGGILCEQIQRSADYKYCLLDCQNGGTCVYIGTTPSCRCPEGRNGRLCEKRSIAKILSSLESDLEDSLDVPTESDYLTEDFVSQNNY